MEIIVEDMLAIETRDDVADLPAHPVGTIDSVTLARLLEEVRNADGPQQPTAYNRMHNRHNRS